jgi:plasmid stabilization system protein ParE
LKITFSQTSRDDLTRQFRYYLLVLDRPDLANSFKGAVRKTVALLKEWPHIAPVYQSQKASRHEIRSWPVAGFEVIRVYFRLEGEKIFVIRILHGKRNVRMLLGRRAQS